MKLVFVLAVCAALLCPAVARADISPVKTVCRGSNIPGHVRLVRQAVKQKLEAASISYKFVRVSVAAVRRKKGTLATDHTDSLTLSSGSTPTVNFDGHFPVPVACEIVATLKIRVIYPSGSTLTVQNVRIPGTMLWFSARRHTNPNVAD